MRITSILASLGWTKCLAVAGLSLALANSVHATVLTWDIFSDAAKTTYVSTGAFIYDSYGDAVSDFNPAAADSNGRYNTYGSTGGYTPDINATYQYRPDNLVSNPGPSGYLWSSGYGDLNWVMWYSYGGIPAYQEMLFTPAPTAQVSILSFDMAGWGNITGQTVKIVEYAVADDPSTWTTLWSAGPDGSITHPGTGHNAYTPNVTGSLGKQVSILWGHDGANTAIDNIVFSQAVPEPGSIALLVLSGLIPLRRVRK